MQNAGWIKQTASDEAVYCIPRLVAITSELQANVIGDEGGERYTSGGVVEAS